MREESGTRSEHHHQFIFRKKVRRDVILDDSRRWRESSARMCDGRLFHRRATATGNAVTDSRQSSTSNIQRRLWGGT